MARSIPKQVLAFMKSYFPQKLMNDQTLLLKEYTWMARAVFTE
jgi:hypothetical protein